MKNKHIYYTHVNSKSDILTVAQKHSQIMLDNVIARFYTAYYTMQNTEKL